jgi:hypothetical protein
MLMRIGILLVTNVCVLWFGGTPDSLSKLEFRSRGFCGVLVLFMQELRGSVAQRKWNLCMTSNPSGSY